MPKPKLLISTDNLLPRWDGIARTLSELIPRLAKRFDVTVVGPDFGQAPKMGNVQLVRFPVMPLRFGDINFAWFHPGKIKRLVQDADVVFNQTIGPIGMCAVRAAAKLNKPCVAYVHSIEWELASKSVKRWKHLVSGAVKWLAKSLYNKCVLILVPNKEVEDLLVQVGITSRKAPLQLGVDTEVFTPPKSRSVAKWKVGIKPTAKVIGFSGRIGREKDLPTLYKAFKAVRKTHPNTVLVIVGGGIETEAYAHDPDVMMVGPRDDVQRWLQAMDVFVLPSLTETSSLATMEAMAVGLPVVVTPVGSIREYVIDGENGLIFPRRDVGALAERLEMLLSSSELRARLGRRARQTILERHRWELVAEQAAEFLMKQVAGGAQEGVSQGETPVSGGALG